MIAIDQLARISRHAVNPRRIANSLEALCVFRRRRATEAASLLLVVLVVGCSTLERLPPEAANLTDQTTVLGIPNARFYADTQVAEMAQEALRAVERERAALPGKGSAADRLPPANYLGISGGSDDGAFGAGLLVGWSDAGTRPEFKLVSGVSTGALIAPFAFLGPAYDPQLRAVYTGVQPADIYEQRSMFTAVFSESFADTAPLFGLISRYVNDDMLVAIAQEYNKGRLLLIGTTNLDFQRPVIWNIGAIAASGRPGAIELVRKILLASAAVPGLFPPVMIDVEGGGKRFQELHVDGGAVAQMFLYPTSMGCTSTPSRKEALARERHAYLIRNGRMDPEWATTDRSLLSIVGRAISTMIYYSGYNDALRITRLHNVMALATTSPLSGRISRCRIKNRSTKSTCGHCSTMVISAGVQDILGARHPRSLKHPPNRRAASRVPCRCGF